jgi:DNA-binding LytR/AlgR family response regulator
LKVENRLRIIIADDERPARSFLAAMLRTFPDVDLIGEAANGAEAVELIERERPDLALLDLQMPELDGLGVVRLLRKDRLPLIAFVTAYDEYAVRAFAVNAVDYLLKPVERARLRDTLNRAQERLERADLRESEAEHLKAAAADYESATAPSYLERIPIRQRDEIVIMPVDQVASVIAEGELLHLTTVDSRRYSFTYRLKDLEARLDPAKFVRLARGTLANVNQINRISPLPGGAYQVTLLNHQQLNVSRLQARILRNQLFKL